MTKNEIAKMTKSQIMKQAWLISNAAAEKFGGRKSEYFTEALKAVWARVKEARAAINRMIPGTKEYNQHLANCIAADRAA